MKIQMRQSETRHQRKESDLIKHLHCDDEDNFKSVIMLPNPIHMQLLNTVSIFHNSLIPLAAFTPIQVLHQKLAGLCDD